MEIFTLLQCPEALFLGLKAKKFDKRPILPARRIRLSIQCFTGKPFLSIFRLIWRKFLPFLCVADSSKVRSLVVPYQPEPRNPNTFLFEFCVTVQP